MAESDFGLSGLFANAPQFDLPSLFPQPLAQPRHTPIIINAPRAQQALSTKYSTYMRELGAQYGDILIQSMMDFDAQRVKNGQAPLGEQETRDALEAAYSQRAVTPEPKRAISTPFDWLRNAVGDVQQMVTSIPKIPSALIHEARAVHTIPDAIAAASNPIAGIFGAPGIRMLPGAFIAESLAKGEPGELARHPVFTALDILPVAGAAAKSTKLYRAVDAVADAANKGRGPASLVRRDFAQLERMQNRPLSTVLFNKAGTSGLPIDRFGLPIRNNAGLFVDALKEGRVGSAIHSRMGRMARDEVFIINSPAEDVNSMLAGARQPGESPYWGVKHIELETLAKRAHDLDTELKALSPDFLNAAGNIKPELRWRWANAWREGNLEGLLPEELSAIAIYEQHMQNITEWSVKNYRNLRIDGEIYDIDTGAKLLEYTRAAQDRKDLFAIRTLLQDGGDPAQAVKYLSDQLGKPLRTKGYKQPKVDTAKSIQRGEVGKRDLNLIWRATQQALRNAGKDTTVLDNMVTRAGGGVTAQGFIQAIDDLRTGRLVLPDAPAMTISEVVAYATQHMGESIGYRDLLTAIKLGERGTALTHALDIIKSDNPAFVAGVKNVRETHRTLNSVKMSAATEKGVARAEATLAGFMARNQAARFLPKKQQLTREAMARRLREAQNEIPVASRWDNDRLLRAQEDGTLAVHPSFTDAMYNESRMEAAIALEHLKEQGFNPRFIHTVPSSRVESSFRIPDTIVPHDPATTKRRVDDLSPGINDLSVSINDITMQFMQEIVTEARLHLTEDMFGYTMEEVLAITHESASRRYGLSGAKSRGEHQTDAITERFTRLDPDIMGISWGSPYINTLKTKHVFVPKEVANVIKEMSKPAHGLSTVFDPITKTFRIATVGLSLRTQIYNVVGGAVALAITDPVALFKYFGEARAMMKNPRLVPDELRVMVGQTKRGLLELDDITKGRVSSEGVRKYMVGEKLRTMWDQIQARKVEGRPITGRFGDKVRGLVEKSYNLNSMVDDMYRSIAYLGEYNRRVAQGFTHEAAAAKAVGAARKVLQDYMAMTPFERNIIKSIIPFYGYIGHAIRFVLRYPFDHPLRAEFMAKFAMAELEDNNMGLPGRFMSMLFFGEQDNKGNKHAFNLGPFNPFGDVANSMTLAGFLGNTNPVIQTAFEIVGLKQGEAELYPSLRYDPETGRMEAAHPSALESLIGNIIPQTSGLMALMGMNAEYNEMRQRDPDAAGRYLLSTLTVPTLERQYNIPQEHFAAEMARQRSAQSVLNNALKTGDWSEAMLYPSLQAYLTALQELTPEQLAPFQPTTRESMFQRAQTAFTTGQQTTAYSGTLKELIERQIALGNGTGQQLTPTGQQVFMPALPPGGALGLNGI